MIDFSKKHVYNEDGIRTSKTVNNVKTTFLLDGYNIIEQTDGTTTLHFFYDSNDEVIGFRYNGNDYFYVKNAMSDIIAITDSNKNIVAEYRYDPWGKVLNEEYLTAIGNLNPFRYRSYYYDSDIQMYYLQSRYYDPEIGRFINSDDVSYIGASGTETGYNPFAYCENNPVNNTDSSGEAFGLIQSMAIGALLGIIELYVMDIIYNLYKGTSPWYARNSDKSDYILAAVSGAISMLSFKKVSTLLSGISAAVDTVLQQWKQDEKVTVSKLFLSIADAVLMDLILPGEGLDLSNKVNIVKTSREKLKSLVSSRKIRLYKDKICKNIKFIIKNGFYNFLSNIIDYAADKYKIQKKTNQLYKGFTKVVRQ